jgi:hypothetical protein
VSEVVLERLSGLQKKCATVGIVGVVLLAVSALVAGGEAVMQSWLVGFLLWLAVSVGSLAFLLLHNLTGGGWGHAIRRVLEASTKTLPFMAVMAVPFLVWPGALWEWAHPDAVAADALLQHKEPFLNVGFFRLRVVVYFALWIGMAAICRKLGATDERERSETSGHRLRSVSGPGLGLFGLTVTFAAIDWGMSLDPHWFSTMYGVSFIVGFALSALCFSVLVGSWLSRREPVSKHVETGQFHDLGNLLLAFTMLWAYIAFSQYLIIWAADLSEEAPYYLARLGPGWQGLALFLLLFHFAMPFFLLLSRRTKRSPRMLATLAAMIFALRFADVTWVIVPSFGRDGAQGTFVGFLIDLVAVVAIGGLWLRFFAGALKEGPLYSAVPDKAPRPETEAPSHA